MSENISFSISVVIPAFNASSTIIKAIQSVINQKSPEIIEIIVIDDGSSDGTAELCTSFFNSTSVGSDYVTKLMMNSMVIKTTNKGVASARNTGIKAASGNYIAFLDSDDEWLPNKTKRQISIFQEHKDAYLCCSGCNIKPVTHKLQIITRKILLKRNPIYTSSVLASITLFLNKEDNKKTFLFDESLRYAEDYNLWLAISSCSTSEKVFYKIDECLFLYSTGQDGVISKGLSSNMYKFEKDELRSFFILYKNKYINFFEFCFSFFFSSVKFIHRIIFSINKKR